MSTTVEQHVNTTLRIIDQATGPMNAVAARADNMGAHVDKAAKSIKHGSAHAGGALQQLSSVFSSLAGAGLVVGAGLSLHSAVESVEKYVKSIKEVHELTGATVGETDFLFSSARRAGVEYETMERTMFQLSRRGALLEQRLAGVGGSAKGPNAAFKAMGVNIEKGPITALTQLSEKVKAGKVGTEQLMANFRIPAGAANDFQEFLKNLDPKKLNAAREGRGGFLGDDTMDAFKAMEAAQHRIADTWNRIKVTVLGYLFPIAAKLAEGLAEKLERALPKIQSVMQFVADHMDHIVDAAKLFVAVMTTKKLLGVADGLMGGHGLLGGVKAMTEAIAKASPLLNKIGMAAGRSVMSATMAGGRKLGAEALLSPALLEKVGSATAGFTVLGAAIVAAAGAAVIAYLAFQAFKKNIKGVGDALADVWGRIKARLELIWDGLMSVGDSIAKVFGAGGSLGETVGWLAAVSFNGLLESLDFTLHLIQTIVGMMSDFALASRDAFQLVYDAFRFFLVDPIVDIIKFTGQAVATVFRAVLQLYDTVVTKFGGQAIGGSKALAALVEIVTLKPLLKPIADSFKRNWEKSQGLTQMRRWADEQAAGKKHGEDSRPPSNHFDFRNSRFDITQNFAEGFDPDRIAVAFSNDLSNLGEMRSQSGFSPITSAG